MQRPAGAGPGFTARRRANAASVLRLRRARQFRAATRGHHRSRHAPLRADTILVALGTYDETIALLGKQLVIESTGGAAVTTINANAQGRTVAANSVGASLAARGGGMVVNDGFAAVTGCTFSGAANHDDRLLPASPCIDAGNPASPHDSDGTPADMGATPFENAFDDLVGASVLCVGGLHA